MKKLFTILVGLLVTASVYSQTYNVNAFHAELGGYVIQTDDGTRGVVVAMQNQGVGSWYDAEAMVNDASKHDSNGAKFKDWRLPTKRELMLIYYQRGSIGGFGLISGGFFWSSTEFDNDLNKAWGWNFFGGEEGYYNKYNENGVRAVRDF